MAYLIGSIIGSFVRVFLVTRLTALICRKIGVKARFLVPCAYLLYILIFWPLPFLINAREEAIKYLIIDIPAIIILSFIDYKRKKNKMKLPQKFFEL